MPAIRNVLFCDPETLRMAMSDARRTARIPTPYRGMARVLSVYCTMFTLIWAAAWVPKHTNIVEVCHAKYYDAEYEEKYPNEMVEGFRLYLDCHSLGDDKYDANSPACVRSDGFVSHDRQYLRIPTDGHINACYLSNLLDNRTSLVLAWFVGIPIAIALCIVGWWLLKRVGYVALAILIWVVAGFDKRA